MVEGYFQWVRVSGICDADKVMDGEEIGNRGNGITLFIGALDDVQTSLKRVAMLFFKLGWTYSGIMLLGNIALVVTTKTPKKEIHTH